MSYSRNLFESLRDAFRGLKCLWESQRNARIHGAVTVAVLLLSGWLRLGIQEFLFIGVAIALVWVAETLNSALEALTDMVSPEKSMKAKHAKDLAAASVLLAITAAVVIGFLVLGPPLYKRLILFGGP